MTSAWRGNAAIRRRSLKVFYVFFLLTIYRMFLVFKVALLHVPVLSNCSFYCTSFEGHFCVKMCLVKAFYTVRPDVESSYSTSKPTFMHQANCNMSHASNYSMNSKNGQSTTAEHAFFRAHYSDDKITVVYILSRTLCTFL